MKKMVVFAILLLVLSVLLLLVSESFAGAENEKNEVFPLVMVEVKKDTPIAEFYDTNSAVRSRMFYQIFLERFAKANNMAAGGFNVLPVGIYFIPNDAVFFKMTKTGIYSAMVINAEPGMTLSEFYATNSLVNRKLSWNFFKERFAEFQEIENSETEFRKLKPGAWIMPVANVFFWTPDGIKSLFEMAFKPVKGGLYSTELLKKLSAAPKEPIKEKKETILLLRILAGMLSTAMIGLLFVLFIFGVKRLIRFFSAKKEAQKD